MPSEFCPDNTLPPNQHTWTASKATGRRWCADCGETAPEPIRVMYLHQLKDVAAVLGVRPDWHEPDEQEVTAEVFGNSFDNCGTWPYDPTLPGDLCRGNLASEGLEMYVNLYKDELLIAQVNLATLFAMACGTYE